MLFLIPMWAIDLTHTTHTRAQTGIQQVCRNLAREFAATGTAIPIVHDHHARRWRTLDATERATLEPDAQSRPPRKRSSSWTLFQKWRGIWSRRLNLGRPLPDLEGVFCPEFHDRLRDSSFFSANLPKAIPRVAFFHDAIALKFPQWTPQGTIDRFPAYLASLARFDHVACVSSNSEEDLHVYWRKFDIPITAGTSVVSLGLREAIQPSPTAGPKNGDDRPLTVLMVGTLEARKNHLALLEGCESLWESGLSFQLHLAGMLNRETGQPAANLINELETKGRPILWEGAVSNERLVELYAEADIFAYPSLYEGFGLPVLEALSHGLPVLTTECGALKDLADGGGCLTCDGTPSGISDSLQLLVNDPSRRQALANEAATRSIRTMGETARDLEALFQELALKPSC